MIWKCEVRNSYRNEDIWVETEIVGDNFTRALKKRFGRLDYRNVKQLVNGKWIEIEGGQK